MTVDIVVKGLCFETYEDSKVEDVEYLNDELENVGLSLYDIELPNDCEIDENNVVVDGEQCAKLRNNDIWEMVGEDFGIDMQDIFINENVIIEVVK